MNKESILKFKGIFEEQRRQILSRGVLDQEIAVKQDDMLDEVDLTSSEMEANMRIRLRNREALLLKKVSEAIRRLDEGTFGECETCGDEIDARRLEARPTATLCVHCKEEQERAEHLHIDGHRHKSLGRHIRLA